MAIVDEQGRIAALRSLKILDTPPEEVFDSLTRLAALTFNVPVALVSLVDSDRQWFKSCIGLDVSETGRDVAFCDHAIRQDEALVVLDACRDPRFRDNPLVTGAPEIRFYAGGPLVMPDGHRIGTLCIIDFEPRGSFSEADRAQLEAMAASVTQALVMRRDISSFQRLERDWNDQRQLLTQAEFRARQSEARFRQLTESSQDVTVKFGLDGTFQYLSPSVGRYGYTPEDLVGTSVLSLVHPDDHQKLAELNRELLQTGEIAADRDRTHRQRTASGGWVWMEGSPGIIKDELGAPVAVISQLRDITDRKAVEEALAASETRYRLLTDKATDVIACYGLDRTFTFVSPAISDLLGYEPAELVGRPCVKFMHPEDVANTLRVLADLFQAGPRAASIRFEYRGRRKDGSFVWLEAHPKPLYGAAGEFIEFHDIVRDISARKAIEAELNLAREASEAASVAKSEFLAVMSHEIRTPLNGVLGMAHVMGRGDLSAVQREHLAVIRQSGEALLAILNDVLDLSKIEAGKLVLEAKPFDLESLALGAHGAFTGIAHSKGLSFNLTVQPAARGAYLGDSARVRQILYNLISNAVKFTAQGDVRVSIDRLGENVLFRVSDTGVGIDPDQIAGIFDRFVQADSSITRKYGGSGLGLAITRDLCTAMGGSIDATSEPGVGTVFEVLLPLEAVASIRVAPSPEPEDEGFSEPGRAFNILAAEDNPINQLVLKTLLAQFDLSVTIVENGLEAVASWRTGEWDLILMDVQMPGLDGPSAARQIRDLEAETGRAPVPIVALTANAMLHQIETYYAAGMNDVIAKPIDVRDLLRVIQAVASAEGYDEATDALTESRGA